MKSNASMGLDPEHSASQAFLWSIVRKLLPRGGKCRVLDLGCGPGVSDKTLIEAGYEVVGIDVSAEAVEIARRTVPKAKYFVADIYEPPWAEVENRFDVVLALEVIEHLYYPRRLIQVAGRCLRPGGVFIVSTPYHGYAKNLVLSILDKWDDHHNIISEGWHIKFFSPRSLRTLIEGEGFTDICFRYGGRLPYLWKSMVCRSRKP